MNPVNVKLLSRGVLILFMCYLAYTVTSVEFINSINEGKESLLKITTGSVFAALAMIIKYHFETTPSDTSVINS